MQPIGFVPVDSPTVDVTTLGAPEHGPRDALASPDRRIVLALTKDGLEAFRVSDVSLRQPLLKVPLPVSTQIVMAEWSRGKRLESWRRAIPPLLEN